MGNKVKLVLSCDAKNEEKCAECGRKALVYLKVAFDDHILPCYPDTSIAMSEDYLKFCLSCVEKLVEKAKAFIIEEGLDEETVGC